MKKSVVLLGLFAAACSSGAPTVEQQRITQLEQEKAQLEAQLKEARSNVARLQAVLGRGGFNPDAGAEPSGPVLPQPVDPTPQNAVSAPQPDNNLGGQAKGGKSIE